MLRKKLDENLYGNARDDDNRSVSSAYDNRSISSASTMHFFGLDALPSRIDVSGKSASRKPHRKIQSSNQSQYQSTSYAHSNEYHSNEHSTLSEGGYLNPVRISLIFFGCIMTFVTVSNLRSATNMYLRTSSDKREANTNDSIFAVKGEHPWGSDPYQPNVESNTMLFKAGHVYDIDKDVKYDMAPSLIDSIEDEVNGASGSLTLADEVALELKKSQSSSHSQFQFESFEEIFEEKGGSGTQKKGTATKTGSVTDQHTQASAIKTEQSANNIAANSNPAHTVAYVLPVFECPKYKAKDHTSNKEEEIHEKIEDTAFLDAAAVLKYTVHRNSIHNPLLQPPSKYSYKMIAIVHPEVMNCYDQDGYSRVEALRILGYDVRIMDIPVPIESMQGDYLKTRINHRSDTGARDLIRINAFKLVEFDVVVLLDLRAMIVKPLDDLIDLLILDKTSSNANSNFDPLLNRIELAHNSIIPTSSAIPGLSALYTREYSSVSPLNFKVGIYPGLFLVQPSMQVYQEFVSILMKADFRGDSGWGGAGIIDFPGDMTSSGLLSYYYDVLHPEEGLELNRCRYNNLGSTPYIRAEGQKVCRNQKEKAPNCQDCRTRGMDELSVANMSACRDPWSCYHHAEDMNSLRLCREMHSFWFKARRELEGAWKEHGGGGEFGYHPAKLANSENRARPQHFLGYCSGSGKAMYIPMVPPGIDKTKEGPALDTNDILHQFSGGATNEVRKPKKHFDPEAVIYQFSEGHPKQGKIGN